MALARGRRMWNARDRAKQGVGFEKLSLMEKVENIMCVEWRSAGLLLNELTSLASHPDLMDDIPSVKNCPEKQAINSIEVVSAGKFNALKKTS